MNRLKQTAHNKIRRKARIRKVINGTTERPRLSVYISNQHISVQLIDDSNSHTLAAATTVGKTDITGSMTSKAETIGEEIAKLAKQKKIKQVVFDRNGRLYHGRIKALADKARAGGLEF